MPRGIPNSSAASWCVSSPTTTNNSTSRRRRSRSRLLHFVSIVVCSARAGASGATSFEHVDTFSHRFRQRSPTRRRDMATSRPVSRSGCDSGRYKRAFQPSGRSPARYPGLPIADQPRRRAICAGYGRRPIGKIRMSGPKRPLGTGVFAENGTLIRRARGTTVERRRLREASHPDSSSDPSEASTPPSAPRPAVRLSGDVGRQNCRVADLLAAATLFRGRPSPPPAQAAAVEYRRFPRAENIWRTGSARIHLGPRPVRFQPRRASCSAFKAGRNRGPRRRWKPEGEDRSGKVAIRSRRWKSNARIAEGSFKAPQVQSPVASTLQLQDTERGLLTPDR